MKLPYTPEVLALIDLVKATFPAEKSDSRNWPKGLSYLLTCSLEQTKEVTNYVKYLQGILDGYTTKNVTASETEVEITFTVYKSFNSRVDLLTWCESKNLTLPTACTKDGVLVENKIHTQVTHLIQFKNDCTFSVYYTREGPPTARCRVETSTHTSVVCDIYETPQDPTSVPF